MNASLNEKLRMVKWGEFKLGELFEIASTSSFEINKLVLGDEYDYVTRTSTNQGVLQTTGFVNFENINQPGTWSLGLLQMDFFYRKKPWYAGQFMRIVTPKIDIPQGAIPFFTTMLNKQKSTLLSVLVRNVDKTFRSIKVQVPVSTKGDIDFAFMEDLSYELETERIAELKAYIEVNGLNRCQLTEEDEKAIAQLKHVQWGNYRIGALFEKIETNKLPYQANELPSEKTREYVLPCLTSSFKNQGLNYYSPKQGATILKDVITIPQNSDVYRAYYQSSEFTVLSDAYAIEWRYDDRKLTREQYLFMVMCINKVTDLPIYSHKNKLGGWNVVRKKTISLPQTNGKIDFEFMNQFISAIEKQEIRGVVDFINNKVSENNEDSNS